MAVIVSYKTGAELTYAPEPPPRQDASQEAVAAMAVFAEATATDLAQGLGRGAAYPMLDGGRVVWVHPDGTRRLTADSASLKA
jgi:hypothetical protein